MNLDALWGGTITGFVFDFDTGTARLRVSVLDDGRRTTSELVVYEVTEIDFVSTIALPWNYAELTEVHVEPQDQGVSVQLVLWSEEATMRIRGVTVTVDVVSGVAG